MFGSKALSLIKESSRNTTDFLPPYNEQLVQEILEEMSSIFDENKRDAEFGEGNEDIMTCIQVRHAALLWNKMCLLTYHHSRLQVIKEFRWQFGQDLPESIAINLSAEERTWFNQYS